MESDLSRFHQVRYSDRWRRDSDGRRLLTLREIYVRITDLPGDSRIAKHYNDGRPRWTDEAYLLADLIHVTTGKPHPARPTPDPSVDRRETPERARLRRKRIRERNKRQRLAAARRAEAKQ